MVTEVFLQTQSFPFAITSINDEGRYALEMRVLTLGVFKRAYLPHLRSTAISRVLKT